jgi:hypothetical protein
MISRPSSDRNGKINSVDRLLQVFDGLSSRYEPGPGSRPIGRIKLRSSHQDAIPAALAMSSKERSRVA